MNLVGRGGRGESVVVLGSSSMSSAVLPRWQKSGATRSLPTCREQAEAIRRNIEANAWDGRWYRRAYLDDGRPLGSAANAECQIDSLPQSWAAISGAADQSRSRLAVQSVLDRLYLPQSQLIKLLDPPFDVSAIEPGHQGLPPRGPRERRPLHACGDLGRPCLRLSRRKEAGLGTF